MKISDLQSLLTRVQQYTQDAEVILQDAESGARTVLQDVEIKLTADGTASSTVTITHAPAPPAPADVPTDTQAPAETADQTATVG